MGFFKRAVHFFSFKMHTWHTVHGEGILEISVKLLGLIFADINHRTQLIKILSTCFRVTTIIATGLAFANFFFVDSIGNFAKTFEVTMIGVQVC